MMRSGSGMPAVSSRVGQFLRADRVGVEPPGRDVDRQTSRRLDDLLPRRRS